MFAAEEVKEKKKYFIKDESLNNVDNDSFNHRDISNVICNIIDSTEPPYNIAVIGKWGLGKSSLINMALGRYKNKCDEYIVHEINAWKYEKEALTKVFLKQLWEGVDGQKVKTFEKIKQRYADIINAISKPNEKKANTEIRKKVINDGIKIAFISIAVYILFELAQASVAKIEVDTNFWLNSFISYCKNGIVYLLLPIFLCVVNVYLAQVVEDSKRNISLNIDVQSTDEYEMLLEDKINEKFKNNENFRIITVIDDLDRLSVNKIVEALDAIKAFVGFERCIFIVPFDDAILKKALEENKINGLQSDNETIESELILDKLFQFKIYLPPILKYDIKEYAINLVVNKVPDFLNDYCNEKMMKDLIKNVLIHSGVSTPRQVKKIINIFITNCIIAYNREILKKVDEDVLTSDSALRQIAKVSVLQADFNEFYDLLFKNFDYINKLLEIYINDVKYEEIPEDLRCYFEIIIDGKEDRIRLRKEHVDLINYLSWTNKYKTDHIEQFLFLAQEEISKKTGDENFKKFINAIESDNVKLVSEMIEDNQDNIEILDFKIGDSFDYDIPSVLLIAINVFHLISSDSSKTKLANSISGKAEDLTTVNTSLDYVQLSARNLIDIYKFAENKEFSSNLLAEYINSLNQKNIETKYLVDSVIVLLEEDNISSDEYFGKLIIDLCGNIYSNKKIDIAKLLIIIERYYDNPEMYKRYFDINVFNRIVYELDENNLFEDRMFIAFTNTFLIMEKCTDINVLVENMKKLFVYPILYDIINKVFTSSKIGDLSKENATYIIQKIISIKFVDDTIPDSAIKLIAKLNFDITEDMKNDYDIFMNKVIVIDNNSIDAVEQLLVYSGENEFFNYLPNTIKSIIDKIFASHNFDNIIGNIESYFTDNQKNQLRSNLIINSRFDKYSSYDPKHLISLYEILRNNINNSNMINTCIQDVLNQFNSYYNQKPYFDFVSELMGRLHEEIIEANLEIYINIIINIFAIYINDCIKAIQRVQNEISDEQWAKIIPLLIANISSSNYEMTFSIIEDNSNYFSKEKGNLSQHVSFLVDTMEISNNPNENLKCLERHYNSISKLGELIKKCATIESVDNTIANRVVMKLIENINIEAICDIVIDTLKDKTSFNFISTILSKIKKHKIEDIINTVSKKIDNTTPIDSINRLIEFCLLNKKIIKADTVFSIILIGLENVNESNVINNICNQLSEFGKDYFAQSKKELAALIYNCFNRTGSEIVKTSLLRIVSELKIRRQFKLLLNEQEQAYYESNIK
jgi:hypothetical protein